MSNEAPKRYIMIAGPTASGKSQLAIDLALAFNGEVINADSMQLYADLSILTARPSAVDKNVVPHQHWPRKGLKPEHKNCPHFLMTNGRPGRKWRQFIQSVKAEYNRIYIPEEVADL